MDCVFLKKVEKEEGKNFQLLIEGQIDVIKDENENKDEDEE